MEEAGVLLGAAEENSTAMYIGGSDAPWASSPALSGRPSSASTRSLIVQAVRTAAEVSQIDQSLLHFRHGLTRAAKAQLRVARWWA